MEQKTFIEPTNNMHTGENVFYNFYFWRFVRVFY